MIYRSLQLDRFQEDAIQAIDQEHSVIVAAPTGAGKTVVADYAVDRCIQSDRRVIYTAPIKALSNQKYRDFHEQYGDRVGILTGDVVLNPYAQILLMTTEIFRNTIFDDIERLADVEYAIFDEIHYINDVERGTVWEESIIFAPQHIKFACLSATIPNIDQFADWMRSVREIEIDVVQELERPVPLEHHLYLDGYGIGTVGDLRRSQQIIAKFNHLHDDEKVDEVVANAIPNLICTDLVGYIQKRNQLPCLYFCFSRKQCERHAESYAHASGRSFLKAEQREQILTLFDSLCVRYGIHDNRKASELSSLISKGVAYHHAGMLPTLKEVVEQLFTSGLVQLLFTTETFAVGINMPACTAIFESLEKFDGFGFRYLKAREYHQMAGRAGRRGIDPVGYVYARVNPQFSDFEKVQHITSDRIEPIGSQFNLSYSSILNLYQKYGDDIYDVCTLSLGNFQNYTRIRKIDKDLKRAEEGLKSSPLPTCVHDHLDASEQVAGYLDLLNNVANQKQTLKAKRLEVKRKYRGRKNKRVRLKRLAHINQQVRHVETTLVDSLCHGCQRFKLCHRQYQEIEQFTNQVGTLVQERDYFEHFQQRQIASRLKVLEELGYIEGTDLFPRGEIASRISGYEMPISLLLFGGYFEKLDEDEINVLMMAIVSEPRKDSGRFRKLQDNRLKGVLKSADREIEKLRVLEALHGVAEVTPRFETKLSTAMLAWSRGCEFEQLHRYADLADGDFVRSIRLVIDFLRQTRRAMSGHATFLDKLDRCISKINRDVVDAERQLRMAQGAAPSLETSEELGAVDDVNGNHNVIGNARLSPES